MATITYVRKKHKGYYLETQQEIDATVWEGQIGTTYEDFLNDMWIKLSTAQVRFHKKYPLASVKEVIEMSLTPDPGRTLEQAKSERLALIQQYDESESVNGFEVVLPAAMVATENTENPENPENLGEGEESEDTVTITAWFTAAERSNHKNTLDAAELLGLPSVDVPLGGQVVTLPLQVAKIALARIQLYADTCYGVTATHKANVEALETIEAVDNYDYTQGYPERLTFDLTEEE